MKVIYFFFERLLQLLISYHDSNHFLWVLDCFLTLMLTFSLFVWLSSLDGLLFSDFLNIGIRLYRMFSSLLNFHFVLCLLFLNYFHSFLRILLQLGVHCQILRYVHSFSVFIEFCIMLHLYVRYLVPDLYFFFWYLNKSNFGNLLKIVFDYHL